MAKVEEVSIYKFRTEKRLIYLSILVSWTS